MATRYWVADGGNWSDNAAHWSASSGGAPGASTPTSADDAVIDASSFSMGAQSIVVDAVASCKNLTAANTFAPVIGDISSSNPLNIYGDFTLDGVVSVGQCEINLAGASGSMTLTSNGSIVLATVDLSNGVGSTKTFNLGSNLMMSDGISTGSFGFGNGVFKMNGFSLYTRVFSLPSGTGSTIDGHLTTPTYNSTGFLSTPTGSVVTITTVPGGVLTGFVQGVFDSLHLTINTSVGPVTSATALTIDSGLVISFAVDSLFTFTSFIALGTSARPITLTSSVTVITSSSVNFAHLIVKGIDAEGAASPFDAGSGSVSRGGNTNWIFPNPNLRIQNVFMVGAATNGTVQTINLSQSDDGQPIFYELFTQELEFGNRAHLKKIANDIAVFTQFGAGSALQAITDFGPTKDIDMNFDNRVNIGEAINIEGHFVTFRWFGQSSTVSPIFEGFYLENITDVGMTQP